MKSNAHSDHLAEECRSYGSTCLYWTGLFGMLLLPVTLVGAILLSWSGGAYRPMGLEHSQAVILVGGLPTITFLVCGLVSCYYVHIVVTRLITSKLVLLGSALAYSVLCLTITVSWGIIPGLMLSACLALVLSKALTWALTTCQLLGKDTVSWKIGAVLLKLVQYSCWPPLFVFTPYVSIVMFLKYMAHQETPDTVRPAITLFLAIILMFVTTVAIHILTKKAKLRATEILVPTQPEEQSAPASSESAQSDA